MYAQGKKSGMTNPKYSTGKDIKNTSAQGAKSPNSAGKAKENLAPAKNAAPVQGKGK